MLKRMDLNEGKDLYRLLSDNLEQHKELSVKFDCHIIDLDIYYKYELYTKEGSDYLCKAINNSGVKYSYTALYDDKPVLLSHGTSEENLKKILDVQKLIAGNSFNYGIWFTEVGTGYYWEFPKYINVLYNKPTLRVIESMDDFMVPAMGCVISCEDYINLNEFKYNITDKFDSRVSLEVAQRSLGMPLDLRETKVLYSKSVFK